MAGVKGMKRKDKSNDHCSPAVRGTRLILQLVLFVLFLKYFGVPSVEQYLDQETIVIHSEEKTNGIKSPAITFAAFRKERFSTGWKSVQKNLSHDTFDMFDHCQRINLTNIESCLKNDTIERGEFLKSVTLGLPNRNSSSLGNNSSVWSEDVTSTYMGRQFTLKTFMTLSPTDGGGKLTFKLDNSFDYIIWLHDENFFIPNLNPSGPPNKRWKVNRKNSSNPGLYHRITLTKQKKLNLDRQPCEEDPSYSFSKCTKEKLSQKIGCRLPWDKWSKQDREVCKRKSEFQQFEQIYLELYDAEFDKIEEITNCKRPCVYNEFKFGYTSPEVMPSIEDIIGFWVASRKTQIEEEVLLYPLTSFIAEFGGALGLFLGFSFMTIWQQIEGCF